MLRHTVSDTRADSEIGKGVEREKERHAKCVTILAVPISCRWQSGYSAISTT